MAILSATAMDAGVWLIGNGGGAQSPPQPPATEGFAARSSTTGRPATGQPPPGVAAPLPASVPTRVRVPAVKVDAPLMNLGLLDDGGLATPPEVDRNLAGWYASGTAPGVVGTALIAGHVDNHAGPAVFYNLGALRKGDTVEIQREDGRTAVFSVDAVEVFDGDAFPDRKVYGAAVRPELRLITCGGGFSEERQEYLGNVVVFAHLTGAR